MTKTIGNYTVKLDGNSNLITIYNKSEMIYGKAFGAYDSGSAFTNICTQVQTKVNKENAKS